MRVDSIVIYRSFINSLRKIKNLEERCRAYDALFDYGLDHIETELSEGPAIALEIIKPLLDAQYNKKMKLSENGKKGGRPSKVKTTQSGGEPEDKVENENLLKGKKTKINQEKANETLNDNVNDNANDNVNANDKKIRHKHGQYKNVLLSDEDLEKLKKEFPYDWQEWIEKCSSYCRSKGKHYSDYLATIRAWARSEKKRMINYSSGNELPSYDVQNNVRLSVEQERELLELMGKEKHEANNIQ